MPLRASSAVETGAEGGTHWPCTKCRPRMSRTSWTILPVPVARVKDSIPRTVLSVTGGGCEAGGRLVGGSSFPALICTIGVLGAPDGGTIGVPGAAAAGAPAGGGSGGKPACLTESGTAVALIMLQPPSLAASSMTSAGARDGPAEALESADASRVRDPCEYRS